jgi:hypothetical protein
VFVGVTLGYASTAAELICGDTDGDGLYETEDIQECLDNLDGPGPHSVVLAADMIFEPHLSQAPYYNSLGFVELDSSTTLDCQGSTIRGIEHVDKQAPSAWGSLWVVTNSDHGGSQSDIWVRNCVIDGGMPSSYNEDAQPFDHDLYMGYALYGVERGGLIGSRVQNTHHACAYIRSSIDIDIDDNQFVDCGGANNAGSFGQPAVYLFQQGQLVQERISVRRNWAIGSGSALYATRISEANAEFQTAWMSDVTFEDNYGNQQGRGKPCLMLRGVRGVVVRGNTCEYTQGILTTDLNSSYCSDNPAIPIDPIGESSCLENVLIEDNVLRNVESVASTGALSIYDYHDGVIVRRNRVERTERLGTSWVPCMRWKNPIRNLEVENLCGFDCDGWGIEQHPASVDQVGSPIEEAVTMRNIVINGSRLEGVLLRKRLEGFVLDGLAVRLSQEEPFLVLGELVGESLTRIDTAEGPLPEWAESACPVPEPNSTLLLVSGCGFLAAIGRRRMRP